MNPDWRRLPQNQDDRLVDGVAKVLSVAGIALVFLIIARVVGVPF